MILWSLTSEVIFVLIPLCFLQPNIFWLYLFVWFLYRAGACSPCCSAAEAWGIFSMLFLVLINKRSCHRDSGSSLWRHCLNWLTLAIQYWKCNMLQDLSSHRDKEVGTFLYIFILSGGPLYSWELGGLLDQCLGSRNNFQWRETVYKGSGSNESSEARYSTN